MSAIDKGGVVPSRPDLGAPARPSGAPAPLPLGIIVGGFFLSGAAGLVDEVAWSRYLALLIGGTTAAQTVVLATFMGGLALGNALLGRRADRTTRPLRLYAALELVIGLYCVAFPEIFDALSALYVTGARPLGFGAPGTWALKVALSVASILLPATLMGGTLPILARATVTRLGDVTSGVGLLYFVNSLGAVAGIALAGFVLIEAVGVATTVRLAGAANLALAALFWALDRRVGPLAPAPAAQAPDAAPRYPARTQHMVLAVVAVSGALTMTFEVAWSRLLSLVMGSSTYSFSIMLLSFISGIALGSLAVRSAFDPRRPESAGRDPLRWLVGAEVGVFVSLLPVLPLSGRLPYSFVQLASVLDRTPENFAVFLALKVAIAFALMLLPAFCLGMALPLASRVAVDQVAVVGRRVGTVFSVNIAGSVVGAVGTGLVLLPWLGLRGAMVAGLAAAALLAAGLLMGAGVVPAKRARAGAAAMLAAWALVAVGARWDPLVMHMGLYRHKDFAAESYEGLLDAVRLLEVVEAHDGSDSSVALLRRKDTGNIYLKVNGKTDAGTGGDMSTQLWLGHLGMLLHPDPREALVIGVGSGITCGSLLRHPDVRLDAVEISAPVAAAARTWFGPHNDHALDDPRMRLLIGDAKELFKLTDDRRYDVISSEPSNPWMAGIGNLFSREFFLEARDHLTDDGLLVQWIHLYELNDELMAVILNTLTSVFPHVEVWQSSAGDVLLLASPSPIDPDPATIDARLRQRAVADDLNRFRPERPLRAAADVLAHRLLTADAVRRHFPGHAPHNTDLRPLLEYRAPRAFFANERVTILHRLAGRPPATRGP